MSPFVGGAFGSGLRPQYQVVLAVLAARALQALGAARADPPADVRARLPAGDDPADRAGRECRRNARCDHARGDHDDVAIRGLLPQRDRLVGPALQVRQREIRAQARAARSCRRPATCARRAPRPASMRWNARWTSLRSRSSSIRSSCACAATRTATRTTDLPYSSKKLRECYRQGAEAFGWDKRKPRAALDARRQRAGRLGHGDRRLGSAADADHGAHRADRQRPCGGLLRDLRHRHRHLHDHGAGRGRHARAAARERQHQARRFDAAAIAGRGRIVDCGLGVERRS